MEWRKVKNFIILVLLLVNGFLLVLVGTRRGEVRRYEQSALDQAIQVLEKNGIQVSESGIAAADGLPVRSVERSVSAEEELARALLDETVSGENLGGGLYTYRGVRGQVSFRAGGELSAVMERDDRWYASDPQTMVQQLLSVMGVDAEVIGADLDGGSGTVTFRQLWQGAPLFSCQLVFTFEESYLVSLSGSLLASEEAVSEEESLLSLPTALLHFLDGILSSGDVCSAVVSMEPGYYLTQSYTSTVRLNPVWLISSNTADYYMDAATGELSRLTGE